MLLNFSTLLRRLMFSLAWLIAFTVCTVSSCTTCKHKVLSLVEMRMLKVSPSSLSASDDGNGTKFGELTGTTAAAGLGSTSPETSSTT